VPYKPTPPAVAARANVLLAKLMVSQEVSEPDPDGRFPWVLYRAEWHAPSATIPTTHKGISVYRPRAWRE
jgi:hypothetical protein